MTAEERLLPPEIGITVPDVVTDVRLAVAEVLCGTETADEVIAWHRGGSTPTRTVHSSHGPRLVIGEEYWFLLQRGVPRYRIAADDDDVLRIPAPGFAKDSIGTIYSLAELQGACP